MSSDATQSFNQALSRYESGDLEGARAAIQEALAITHDDAEVWCLEAQIRLALDDWEAADFALEQALLITPQVFAPHFIQSELFSASQQFEEALEASQKAYEYARNDEQRRDALLQQAEATFGIGHQMLQDAAEEEEDEEPFLTADISQVFDEGLQIVEELLELDRNIPEAWELYANYLAIFNRVEPALNAWETAVELDPSNPEYLHGLAQALEDIEDFEAAHEAFSRLYHLERSLFEEQGDEASLLFPPERFAELAQEAWAETQHEMLEDAFPLVFEFEVDVFPDEELIETASPEAIFDPRVGIHVELKADILDAISDNPPPPVIRLLLLQTNLERDLDSADESELYDHLQHTLANCVDQIYEYMEGDEWEE